MPGEDYLNTLKKAKSTVYGPDREKLGTMGNIFVDRNTGDAQLIPADYARRAELTAELTAALAA